MYLMIMSMMLISLIMILMTMLSLIISKKNFEDREKSSPFECGFDPKSMSRLPFSLRFFLITIIFLIFDVEIALIFPMIMNFKYSNMILWSTTNIIFIMILMLGLYHEWNEGALKWNA